MYEKKISENVRPVLILGAFNMQAGSEQKCLYFTSLNV